MLDGQVELRHRDGHAQQLSVEGNREVLVEHREQAGDLLVLVVGVDGRFLDQRIKLASRHDGTQRRTGAGLVYLRRRTRGRHVMRHPGYLG
jgi:hypothetical protein